MFSLLRRPQAARAQINEHTVPIRPGETLLRAALRQGIDFPHSCRVGGCGTCKCRLLQGQVKELTDTGYLLSAREIQQGFILACQSVPRGDIQVEVDLSRQQAIREVRGRVLRQQKLTHDIVRLDVQLEESLGYKAGQYANLTLDALPAYCRSFSFATPVQADGTVAFFIRRIPGGLFTEYLHTADIAGSRLSVKGPLGDFYLRPGNSPLLLIAGGSGLAPLMALLQEALAQGIARPVTLLFGARQPRDLYCLDEIQAIARRWPADFSFQPIVSEQTDSTRWPGRQGLVTTLIPEVLQAGSEAYLCGPPGMIDSAMTTLAALGMPREQIYFDRFTTGNDHAPAAPQGTEYSNKEDACI